MSSTFSCVQVGAVLPFRVQIRRSSRLTGPYLPGFTRDTNQYFTKPSPVEVGDYIEFLAETDLLVSASCCPQGDVSMACGGGGEPVCYPLGVEVYKLEDGVLQEKGWSSSAVSGYNGKHGLPSYSLACTTASG